MRPWSAAVGSFLFLVAAPGTVALYVPWRLSRWRLEPALLGTSATRALGALLLLPAAIVLVESFVRFARQGLGTPMPALPTEHLVVTGFYRYVRNPMYVAVVSLVLGQALVFGSTRVLSYAAALAAAFHAFVLLYEEPTLAARYGASYRQYGTHVRRWWPRVRPWPGPAEQPP